MSKRAPKGQGMIRKRQDGLWQARINTGYDPATGKPVRRSIYGKTQSEVRKKLTAVQKSIDMDEYITPSNMTVQKWCSVYMDKYTNNLKPNTKYLYERTIRLQINPHLGKKKLCKLKQENIQSFYQSLLDEGISPSTLRTIHNAFHSILNKAVTAQILNRNPADNCVLPKVEKPKLLTLESEQVQQFMDIIKGKPYENTLLFILFTGVRRREACGLAWDAIDFDKGIVRIQKQLYVRKKDIRLITPKNGKTRILHPAPQVMQILKDQKEKQDHWKEELGTDYNNPMNLVFTHPNGRYLQDCCYTTFKKVMKMIGVDEMRLHDLRHTYATISIMMGDDLKTVSENLGHSSSAFTMDVYGHVTEEMKQKSSKNMQEYIDALQKKRPQNPSE